MKRPNILITRKARFPRVAILFLFLLAACTPAAKAGSATNGGTVLSADNQKLGKILVNASGMTLYTFAIDTPEESKCTGQCTAFWPPYTIGGEPTPGTGITGALSTISRPNSEKQVTYNGRPLYTFSIDKNPGDVNGDGIDEFGGIWHVVTLSDSSSGSISPGDRP